MTTPRQPEVPAAADQGLEVITRMLSTLQRKVKDLERAGRLGSASMEDATLEVYDDDDVLQVGLGRKRKGKWGAGYLGTAQPPRPTIPDVLPIPGALIVFWDGQLEEATDIPLDRVAVYASDRSGFKLGETAEDDDEDIVEVGAIYSEEGGACVIPTWGEDVTYIRIAAISENDVRGPASQQVDGSSSETNIDFQVDEFVLTEAGAQDLTLTYEPIAMSEHLYWHVGGEDGAGMHMQDNVTWTREGQVVSLTGLPVAPRVDDLVVVKYAYLIGQPAGSRVVVQIVSSDHAAVGDDGACGAGSMVGAVQDYAAVLGNNGGPWYDYYAYRWGHATAFGPASSDWLIYAVVADNGFGIDPGSDPGFIRDVGYGRLFREGGILPEYDGRIPLIWGNDGNAVSFGQRNNWQPAAHPEPSTPLGELLGVGMIYKPNFDWSATQWDTPLAVGVETAAEAEASATFVGRHQPSRCAFYYGTKIWDLDGTTIDEPGGPLGEGGGAWDVNLRHPDVNGDLQATTVEGVNNEGPWDTQELGRAVLNDLTLRFITDFFSADYPDVDHVSRVAIDGTDDEGTYVGHRYTLTASGDTLVLDVKSYVDPDDEEA